LKRRDIEAFSAKDIDKLGLTDEEQIEVAINKQAVIFTHDVDFLRIVLHKQHSGMIYVHQQKLSVGECIRRLKAIVEIKSPEEMRNQIIFL
jgi:predicted nuclease of predicted toxin-antitoxin system